MAASGNSGLTDGIGFPACISQVISVGNTTKSDKVNSSSNSVDFLDLLAPGTDVESAVPSGATCLFTPPGPYCEMTGTSQAAPHVAGLAADIAVPSGMTAEELVAIANREIPEFNTGGVGLYDTFVHFDVRGRRARWDNRTGV